MQVCLCFCFHSPLNVIIFVGTISNRESTTPLNLDAIPSVENQVAKSSEQEVISMLLAHHGIIPVSSSLDVPTFTVQTSPTFHATSLVSDKSNRGEEDTKVDVVFVLFIYSLFHLLSIFNLVGLWVLLWTECYFTTVHLFFDHYPTGVLSS